MRAKALRGLCGGRVHLPGDGGYGAARLPWNLAVDQRPAAVVFPRSAVEVAAVLAVASDVGLRVAVQGTGHNAGPLGPLEDVVLLRTSAMTALAVMPGGGRVRVQAGALWGDVVDEAAGHGCSVLHGSSPDVGVVGYSLGGGLGWYARRLGLQTNAVTAAELVTADAELRRVDAQTDPELFWALRGGGGNLGVITELEFRTFGFTSAYAGMLVWDMADAERVLSVYADWAPHAPDAVTTSFRLLRLPPVEDIPAALRGRDLVVIDGAVLASDDDAKRILAPLRSLRPELDTFARVPSEALSRLHMDPEGPTPAVSRTATLTALPPDGVDALLAAAGPHADTSLLTVELRQLGGALARHAPDAGALPGVEGTFLLFAAALAVDSGMALRGESDAQGVIEALSAWHSRRLYLNFVEQDCEVSAGYDSAAWQRLVDIRADVDPHGLLLANHEVPARLHAERIDAGQAH